MTPPPQLETILVERLSDGAVLLSYNRPKISNAFTPQQYNDLREALVWARDERAVRVIVVTGKGKHYCAGRAMGGSEGTINAEVEAGSKLSQVLLQYPKVLMAAAHGDAFFETPFMPLGLVPQGGSPYAFPKQMGKAQANALLLAGERLSAQEAYVGGLITAVVQGATVEEFLANVTQKAKRMGGYSSEALQMAKRLVMDANDDVEARQRAGEREKRDILIRFSREETQANLRAFGARKGKPKM